MPVENGGVRLAPFGGRVQVIVSVHLIPNPLQPRAAGLGGNKRRNNDNRGWPLIIVPFTFLSAVVSCVNETMRLPHPHPTGNWINLSNATAENGMGF